MKSGRGVLAGVAVAFCLALAAPAPAVAAGCRMADADAIWVTQALRNWRVVEREVLKLAPQPLPTIIVADAACTYTAIPGRGDALTWAPRPHGETIHFPDGKDVPAGPVSFAAPVEGDPAGGYFAMSLPSVWRAAGVQSGLGLERLMDGVLLHEMMHTRQFYFVNPRLALLTRQYHLPEDIGDDSLQDTFGKIPDYVAAYTAERDMLFAAAAAPSDAEARVLAGKALTLMRARRAKWFIGDAVKWAQLDDLFLDMEGLGQWTAYAWFVRQGLPRDMVLREVRRGGKYWTQDEGLALFLTLDRLVPGWQAKAFSANPPLAEGLLALAAGEQN